MAGAMLSSTIFYILFIIFSLYVDGHMEHRKLSGTKETMTTRRNLERNGNSEITASPSWSHHSGQKNTQHKPSKIHPDQAAKTATKTTSYVYANTLPCIDDSMKCTHGFP
ncbi:unnamed protein product [Brassica oleracea var. botrytis]